MYFRKTGTKFGIGIGIIGILVVALIGQQFIDVSGNTNSTGNISSVRRVKESDMNKISGNTGVPIISGKISSVNLTNTTESEGNLTGLSGNFTGNMTSNTNSTGDISSVTGTKMFKIGGGPSSSSGMPKRIEK